MAIIKSNQGRIYFIPPTGTPAGQIKGAYTDTYTVTSVNKSEFEGFFTSYDTVYFGNLTISGNLGTINIPHKKTIVCNGRFLFTHNTTTIVVGPNTVVGQNQGDASMINYWPSQGNFPYVTPNRKGVIGSSTYNEGDAYAVTWAKYENCSKFDWSVGRRGAGGGHGTNGWDSAWCENSGTPYKYSSGHITIGPYTSGASYDHQVNYAPVLDSFKYYNNATGEVYYTGGSVVTDRTRADYGQPTSDPSERYGVVNATLQGYFYTSQGELGEPTSSTSYRSGVSWVGWRGRAKKGSAWSGLGTYGDTNNAASVLPDAALTNDMGGSAGGAGHVWDGSSAGFSSTGVTSYGGGALKIMAKICNIWYGGFAAEGQRSKCYLVNTGLGNRQYGIDKNVDDWAAEYNAKSENTVKATTGRATSVSWGKIAMDSGAGAGGGLWFVVDTIENFGPYFSLAGGRGFLNYEGSEYGGTVTPNSNGVGHGGGNGGNGVLRLDYGVKNASATISTSLYWATGGSQTITWGDAGNSYRSYNSLTSMASGPSIVISRSSTGLSSDSNYGKKTDGTQSSMTVTATNGFGALDATPTISIGKNSTTNIANNASMTLSSAGVYTYSWDIPLLESESGSYNITIKATDQSYSSSTTSSSLYVDNTAPAVSLSTPTTRTVYRAGEKFLLTIGVEERLGTSVTLSLTPVASTFSGSSLSEFSVTNKTAWTTGTGGTYTLDYTVPVGGGDISFTIAASDIFGNAKTITGSKPITVVIPAGLTYF